jgi:peptidoglycan/LPS O-acetylase OafA/YrhL
VQTKWSEAAEVVRSHELTDRAELQQPAAPRRFAPGWELDRDQGNNFTLLRLLLAILVIYSHSFPLLLGNAEMLRQEPFRRLTRGQITGGGLAVDAFFVISGFLICQSWHRTGSAWLFLQKRVARIYPAYLGVALFCLVVVGSLAVGSPARLLSVVSLPEYLFNTLGLQMINLPEAFARNPCPHFVNGSTWTIRYEFWCYLAILGLGVAGVYRRPALLLALLGLMLLLENLHRRGALPLSLLGDFVYNLPIPFNGHWPRLGSCFLAGVVASAYRDRLSNRPLWIAASALLLALACLSGRGLWLAVPTAGAYLLLSLAFQQGPFLSRLRPQVDLSYGLYLYAFPVQQLLVHSFRPVLNPFLLFLVALPPTTLCALGSWYLIEQPWLARKPIGQDRGPRSSHWRKSEAPRVHVAGGGPV